MSQNPQNPFALLADMNKQMFDTWSSWASSAAQQAEQFVSKQDGESANPFRAYLDFFTNNFAKNPFLQNMSGESVSGMADQMYKQWQEGLKNMSSLIPNKAVKDGLDRFMNSFQMYSGLHSFWDNFMKNMPDDIGDWNAFNKTIMQQYENMSKSLTAFLMPDYVKGFFASPIENLSAISQTLQYFFKPWLDDSSELQSKLFKALQGDRTAYTEFLKQWAEVYKNSFAKLFDMPYVGANHTVIEKVMKLLDYYVSFVITLDEFSFVITGMTTDAMENLLNHLSELQTEGNPPQTFMEFYKLWSRFNEQAFADLYSTDEFSRIMNETVSAGSKLQILCDDFIQDLLAFLPIPNRRELDDVELEVYNLRKQVKSLHKELTALKSQIEKPAKPDK